MKKNSDWNCDCGQKLGKFVGSKPYHRIEILGVNGKTYEVGFLYLEVTCNKCRKINNIESCIVLDTEQEDMLREKDSVYPEEPLRTYYWKLPNDRKDLLLKGLTHTQKKIFQILVEENDENLEKISKIIGLPYQKVFDDMSIIIDKAEKLRIKRKIPFWK